MNKYDLEQKTIKLKKEKDYIKITFSVKLNCLENAYFL